LAEGWVVDVGVNIGVTCRWWLSLSSNLDVIGIDMFREALDFTSERVARVGQHDRWHPLCTAVGAADGVAEVRFDNPLEGTSRLDSPTGEMSRKMRMQSLDATIAGLAPERIGLLKLDIEGSAGDALRGASETLGKCDYVVVETHSDEETRTSSQSLTRAGFQLFRCHGRTMWWHRQA
jgi:FkbM family methyltransferase